MRESIAGETVFLEVPWCCFYETLVLAGTKLFISMRRQKQQSSWVNLRAPGSRAPHSLGRLQGELSNRLSQSLDHADLSSATPSLDYIIADNSLLKKYGLDDAVVVEVYEKVGVTPTRIARVAIDSERGYVCPLIEEFNSEGRALRRWVCRDYFQDAGSGLWFPSSVSAAVLEASDATFSTTIEYRFSPAGVRFNHEIPSSRFTCVLPPGVAVIDERAAEQRFLVQTKVALSLDDLSGLSGHPSLLPGSNADVPASETKVVALSRPNAIWWIVGGNVVVVAVLLLVLLYRRWSSPLILFFAASTIAGVSGCGDASPEMRDVPMVSVTPSSIDFGAVASDGVPLTAELALTNNHDSEAVIVNVSSGCGCIRGALKLVGIDDSGVLLATRV